MLYIHVTLINPIMRSVTSLLFILLCFNLFAQNLRNYTSYTVDNGLAQNTVWDAYQDYKGFMWFGTADGVNRFDGYKMYHYRWDGKDSTTLLGNTFYKFYEDSEKRLWVSHNKGVSLYNRTNDCFLNIVVDANINNPNGERYTTILNEDNKGRIWCVSGSLELMAINKNTLQIEKKIKVINSNYNLSSIRTCINTNKYIIVYLNDSSTTWFRLNTETDEVNIINGPQNRTGYFIKYNDSTVCTFDKDYFYLYNINQNKFTPIQIKKNEIAKGLSSIISTSSVWWEGKIYIGNNTGLYVFNPSTLTFEERITSFNKSEKIGFYYIQFLRVDRSGNLWVCTNGDGAKCLSPYRNKFKHYNSLESKNKLVKSITTDKDNNIYTGLYAEGIITYPNNGKLEQFKFGKSADELTHVLAQTFWKNRYFVVNDRYLKELDPKTKREIKRTDVFHYKNIGYCAYPFFYHHKNKLYLSCDMALYEIQTTGQPKILFKFENFDTIITCFTIVNDTSWIIGTNKRIYNFNPISKKWSRLPIHIYIKTLCLTKDQKHVWVGGNSGLYLINTKGKVIQKFNVSEGLPDDFIYGILEDNNGNFWMSHNKGISVYSSSTHNFKHYSVRDGLQSNEFNTGAYHKDANGLLYFGGVNGINIINPQQILHNTHEPPVAINQILLGDLPYKTDTAYNEITQLQLTYLQNTLSFDFSALEFSQPEDNTYKYILEGYDKNWIESGTLHFARYANLPPGNYVFKVLAANGDGVWSNTPKQIHINIIPPYWQRTWFYLLMAFVVLGLIVVVVYLYNKRQQNKLIRELEIKHKLEQERIRISRDLHDNVGAQLSYLITNIDWMLRHPEQINKDEEAKRLQSLSEAGRNAILTLRQTIWAVGSNSLSVDDFADRFKQFAQKMLEFDKSINVTFKENINQEIMLSPAVALNIFRICQEAFNNCLKHSCCSKIDIVFKGDAQQQFLFSITDNGNGFDVNNCEKTNHYGIQNMKARAKECNATLNINSTLGKGTNIIITLN